MARRPQLGRQAILRELAALRPRLEHRGVTHLALFGSRARGDNRGDSDMDLVVDVDETRKFSLLDLVGVGHELEDRIGVPANLFMRRSLSEEFLRHVERDQVVVF